MARIITFISPLFLVFGITLVYSATVPFSGAAPDGNSVLILDTTHGREALMSNNAGFTTVIASAAQWGSLTTAQFGSYRCIILGDPTCGGLTSLNPAEANKATWSAAITSSNIIITGTDESFHLQGDNLNSNSIKFCADKVGQTGLKVSLSCYYGGAPANTPVSVLSHFGSFLTQGAPGCFNDAHVVATHPVLAGVTDASLSNWGCSVHEMFNSYPADFLPLAIARNVTGLGTKTFPDGSSGIPYILAKGVTAVGGKCELCKPLPPDNKCHITTSCAPVSPQNSKTMCSCRPGYKAFADNTNPDQWRTKFDNPGHEHRVFVKPGTTCDILCDNWYDSTKACLEVPETCSL